MSINKSDTPKNLKRIKEVMKRLLKTFLLTLLQWYKKHRKGILLFIYTISVWCIYWGFRLK